MTSIKKAFLPIVELLQANEGAKVSKILPQIIELASAKTARSEGANFIKNEAGETVAIFDYYFKRWMPLVGEKAVEFGAKAKTATGFNTMCKEGVSLWTKQQREAKNALNALLGKVASGEVAATDIAAEQEKIENTRKEIAPTELGFATIDEVNAYLAENGVTV